MMERLTKHKFGNVVSENQEKTGIHCSNFCNNCSQGTGDCKHLKAIGNMAGRCPNGYTASTQGYFSSTYSTMRQIVESEVKEE